MLQLQDTRIWETFVAITSTGTGDSELEDSLNWMTLRYDEDGAITFAAAGTDGLLELKEHIGAFPCFAFLKQEIAKKTYYLLIIYSPAYLSSRDRTQMIAQMDSIDNLFQIRHATLTIDTPESLTTQLVYECFMATPLRKPVISREAARTLSASETPSHTVLPSDFPSLQVKKAASEGTPKSRSGFLTRSIRLPHALRRKPPPEIPPPTPPKDIVVTRFSGGSANSGGNNSSSFDGVLPRRIVTTALHELPHASPDSDQSGRHILSDPSRMPVLKGYLARKWAAERLDSGQVSERKVDAQLQRERERQDAIREEEDRRARAKLEKAEMLRQEVEEEQRRQAILETELQHATMQRRKREMVLQEAEMEKTRLLQDKRKEDKKRRIEETKRHEQWRKERNRQAEEAAQLQEEMKRQAERDREERMKLIAAEMGHEGQFDQPKTGWVTVQSSESGIWKRRSFRIEGSSMLFYKSPKDMEHVLDNINLHDVKGLKEWYDGYEDLSVIPHSFVIENKDGSYYCIFTDSDEEKTEVLAILVLAAGL